MSAALNDVIAYLNQVLSPEKFSADASNNGLQVEGSREIHRAVFGVDACSALFEAAIEKEADFVFVHHGLSWGHGFKYLTGIHADKLRMLFANGISLYAAHLPLDGHPVHGHNAVMADMLDLDDRRMFFPIDGACIGVTGRLRTEMSIAELAETFGDRMNCDYTIYGDEEQLAKEVGIVSGGTGSEGVMAAVENQLGCLIAGEITHTSYQAIRETGLPVICLGHYQSETPGVIRMMELVNAKFGIDCEFIDLPTGL